MEWSRPRALARSCAPGLVVELAGELGAGKTTFVTAYARALGVSAPVTSPTFTLVHRYACGEGAPVAVLCHADLWRLERAEELDDLDLDEALESGEAAIVEWGDRFAVAPGRPRIRVTFEVLDDTTRELVVDASAAGRIDAASLLAR